MSEKRWALPSGAKEQIGPKGRHMGVPTYFSGGYNKDRFLMTQMLISNRVLKATKTNFSEITGRHFFWPTFRLFVNNIIHECGTPKFRVAFSLAAVVA